MSKHFKLPLIYKMKRISKPNFKNLMYIKDIVNQNCFNGDTVKDISICSPGKSKKRKGSGRDLCDGLKIFAFISRTLTKHRFHDIGLIAGNRKHSTMLFHYKQYEGIYKTDLSFRTLADQCFLAAKLKLDEDVKLKENARDTFNLLLAQLPAETIKELFTKHNF